MSENVSNINDGKANVTGVDIDIKQVLGDMIVQQIVSSFTEDQMHQIIDYVQNELFEVREVYDEDTWNIKKKYDLKMKHEYWADSHNCPFLDKAKKTFALKVADDIDNRISEIIASKDYKDTVDEYAHEIVQYASEGWKDDMMKRIRLRMTSDITEPNQYAGQSLRGIIREEIYNYANR